MISRLPSTPALSRATVDRDAATRDDPAALAKAWRTARVLVVSAGTALVEQPVQPGDRPRLVLLPRAEAPDGERLYLGRNTVGAVFAVEADLPDRAGAAAVGLREVGVRLDDHDAGLFVHAVALINWHAAHRCCSRCGAPTEPVRGGSVRWCSVDGSEHFPRTDPAVIMLVHDGDDRCVLGRQAAWPAGRFSTLAGYVEPGESAEMAVVREVAEEVGVAVEDVRYVASQPWPFPSSLMLGFTARCAPDVVPRPVDGELAEARWFSRAQLRAAGTWASDEPVQSRIVRTPSPVSIAWHLISGWLEQD